MAILKSDKSVCPGAIRTNCIHLIVPAAAENLVGYSTAEPSLFKRYQLEPVKDLKLLVKDYAPIAKNALTILVNTSEDAEVLKNLAEDDAFLELLLRRVTVCQ